MSKILTISVAAYNVENYISNTLESLLVDDIDDIEILVEDDGGIDNTANIVKEYEEKYPNVVKLIHKENGGYGSTINKSLEIATGKYFKQLDGDDWYDSNNFKKFLIKDGVYIKPSGENYIIKTEKEQCLLKVNYDKINYNYEIIDFTKGDIKDVWIVKDIIISRR